MKDDLLFLQLWDLYSPLLTDNQREVTDLYFNYDLSLAEIADGVGISRQGVRHVIKKGEEHLSFLEDRLGLAEHYEELSAAKDMLSSIRERIERGEDVSDSVTTLLQIEDILINK